MISSFLRAFEEHAPSVGVVYSRCEYIDEVGKVQSVHSDGVNSSNRWPHNRLAKLLRAVDM